MVRLREANVATRWRRQATAVAMVACVLGSSGCFHFRATAQQPATDSAVGGSRGFAADGRETVWSFLWGSVQESPTIDNCAGQDLAEVTVHSNLAFAILTVITLGTVSPAEVEWRCAKANPSEGEISANDMAAADASATGGAR